MPGQGGYAAAHHALQAILRDPVFSVAAPPSPWWERPLRWVVAHIVRLFVQSGNGGVAWAALAAGLVAVAAGWAVVRWRGQRARWRRPWPSHRQPASMWQVATERLAAGDAAGMLAVLLAAGLAYARAAGWLPDQPAAVTVRRLVRDLARTAAPAEFVALFTTLARAHEAVRYAGRALDAAEAERLLTTARRAGWFAEGTEDGAEARGR